MDGVVGIVCAAGRGNRLVHVKALVESGELGHRASSAYVRF